MRTRTFSFIVLAGLLVLTSGCGPSRIKLSSADAGSQVEAAVGQQIVIRLEGNPTTGYTWEPQDLDTSLVEQVGETEFKSSSPGLVGAGGTQTLTFQALAAGTTELTLVYHRPWEEGVAPIETFTIRLTIP